MVVVSWKRTIPMVLVMRMLTKLFCVLAAPFSVRGGSDLSQRKRFKDAADDKRQKTQV